MPFEGTISVTFCLKEVDATHIHFRVRDARWVAV